MADVMTRSACGLWVQAGVGRRLWRNFTWQQDVVDMPGTQEDLDALALIQADLMGQVGSAGDGFVAPAGVAFVCLHDGPALRAEHPALDCADPAVPQEVIDAADGMPPQPWTVCGVLEDTWRCCCLPASSGSPLVAYLDAWESAGALYGEHLLLAAVHPGEVAALPVFGYADPWARDAEAMASTAAGWK